MVTRFPHGVQMVAVQARGAQTNRVQTNRVRGYGSRALQTSAARDQAQGGGERLRTLMREMAEGDSQALFQFIEEFRVELASTVRSILGSVGRSDVSRKPAEVDFLVQSAGLVLYDRAPRWQPGGAPPWMWANRAIRGEVVRWLGHPRVEFVADHHARAETFSAPIVGDVNYDVLAAQYAEVATWLADVRRVASDRDQRVHMEYQTQKSLGDPSPAHTVAAEFGLQPANVRQIDARVRRRLAATATLVPW